MFLDYSEGVYSILSADVTLGGLVQKIAERIPDETPFPYIWIEDGGQQDWSTKTEDGIEAEVTLHIASRYNGNAEIRRIQNRLHDLLHNAEVASDTQVVLCQFVSSNIIMEQDGQTRHGVMRFRLLVSR